MSLNSKSKPNYRDSNTITFSAFFFSLLTVALVYLISKKARGNKVLGLVLFGIMVSSLFTSGTSFIKLVADPNDQLLAITYWLMNKRTNIQYFMKILLN